MFVGILVGVLVLLAGVWASGGESGSGCGCDSPNVRSVLFRQSDLSKDCWSREELALLFTRRMMQELVPKKIPRNIPLMLDYFKSCLETVKQMATSRRTHSLMLSALADTLGGYLQAFGLPMTKRAYYEGTVNYCVAKQLHELEEAFKKSLRTDGGGWTRPMELKRSTGVMPLRIPKGSCTDNPCTNIITSTDLVARNGGDDNMKKERQEENKPCMRIALPFLDDTSRPGAIAVPFRDRSLYSLQTKASSDILVRYYVLGLRCLVTAEDAQGSSTSPSIDFFNANYHQWLVKAVLPHLQDEIWYPGFGSVLRVIESMNRRGVTCSKADFGSNVQYTMEEEQAEECQQATSPMFYLLIVLAVLILFWLVVLLIYLIYRICFRQKKKEDCVVQSSSTSSSGSRVQEESSRASIGTADSKEKEAKKSCEPTKK